MWFIVCQPYRGSSNSSGSSSSMLVVVLVLGSPPQLVGLNCEPNLETLGAWINYMVVL